MSWCVTVESEEAGDTTVWTKKQSPVKDWLSYATRNCSYITHHCRTLWSQGRLQRNVKAGRLLKFTTRCKRPAPGSLHEGRSSVHLLHVSCRSLFDGLLYFNMPPAEYQLRCCPHLKVHEAVDNAAIWISFRRDRSCANPSSSFSSLSAIGAPLSFRVSRSPTTSAMADALTCNAWALSRAHQALSRVHGITKYWDCVLTDSQKWHT